MPTIEECLEHARQCEWYAVRTNNEEDRKFLLRKAKDWMTLAKKKELEIRSSARMAA
jgi:hypothetical protein